MNLIKRKKEETKMSKEKSKTKTTALFILVAMIAVAGISYSLYNHYVSGSSTLTQLKSNNSGTTASVFQALFITDSNGLTYEVCAPSNYQAMSLLGYETGANIIDPNPVTNIQTCIFFTPTLSDYSGVTSCVFQCYATITLLNSTSGKIIGNLTTDSPIDYRSATLVSGQLQEVVSASATGTALDAFISQTAQSTTGSYNYTVSLTNIGLTIHYQDGKTAILTATSTTANVLTWRITLT